VIPFYMLNEWLVLDGGWASPRIRGFGGFHRHPRFGAYFGLGLALALTRKGQRAIAVQSDETSDRSPCWAPWCCDLLAQLLQRSRAFGRSAPHAIATVLACAGQPWRPFVASTLLRKGRPSSPTWPMQRWPAAWPWAPPAT